MAKIDPNFKFEIYKMLHKPIREIDQKEGGQLLERFILPMQRHFESAFKRVKDIALFYDPTQTPEPQFLKDIVGFTSELNHITSKISNDDLRKLISLAVPLWKQKGLEVGFNNIVKLLTGKSSRTDTWFDYRFIVGETSLGEEKLGQDPWLVPPTENPQKLDEFFTDIRLVDRGGLDRPLALEVLNLMRPISERLRVIYIDVFEDFLNSKGDFVSLGASPSILDRQLMLPENTIEILDTKESPKFQDIALQTKVQITDGHAFGLRFLIQDHKNYYSFRMKTDSQTFELFKVVDGKEVALLNPKQRLIFNNTFYVLSLNTDFDSGQNKIFIRCMMDRNIIFETRDDTFFEGTWGIETFSKTKAIVSEIEMFKLPLQTNLILPNFAA